mmetsp:Transcript_16377/g.40062  ORF Transcript_16377/g.40062 Transcript_16377/m.40062 type:complete len:238 (-) Transcript_16377:321-1034(-)
MSSTASALAAFSMSSLGIIMLEGTWSNLKRSRTTSPTSIPSSSSPPSSAAAYFSNDPSSVQQHSRSILKVASSWPNKRSRMAPAGEMYDPSLHTVWSASSSMTPRLSLVGMPFLRSVGSSVCSISPPCWPCTGPLSITMVSVATVPVRAKSLTSYLVIAVSRSSLVRLVNTTPAWPLMCAASWCSPSRCSSAFPFPSATCSTLLLPMKNRLVSLRSDLSSLKALLRRFWHRNTYTLL